MKYRLQSRKWAAFGLTLLLASCRVVVASEQPRPHSNSDEKMENDFNSIFEKHEDEFKFYWLDFRKIANDSRTFTDKYGVNAIPYLTRQASQIERAIFKREKLILAALARLAEYKEAAESLILLGQEEDRLGYILFVASYATPDAARNILHTLAPKALSQKGRHGIGTAIKLSRLLEGVGDASSVKLLRSAAEGDVAPEAKRAALASAERIEKRLALDPKLAESAAADSLAFWQTKYDLPGTRSGTSDFQIAAERLQKRGIHISADFLKQLLADYQPDDPDQQPASLAVAILAVQQEESATEIIKKIAQNGAGAGEVARDALKRMERANDPGFGLPPKSSQ